jgi:tripartite-type tricarboxylate transporter receptor subunit TctC
MRFKKLRQGVLALCAAAAVTGLGQAHAAFPDRPINVVVPTAAGGTVDIVARIMAEKLGAELGQPVVVINKPGAGGVVGTQAFLREPQDGYTVLFTANSNQLIVPWVYKDAKFDPIKDFAPIAAVGEVPNVLCVNPAFPAKDMKEFMALIKANPEKYQYASAGAGTLNHLLGVMLDQMGGLRMQHIPYRGVSPAMADVMGNQVPMLFASLPSAVEGIKAGKLRALGVSSEKRNALLPDVPAINEAIPGFRGDLWVAFYGAKEAPRAAIDTMMHDGPAELAARQQAEYMQWKQVVQASGASPD